MTWKELGVCRGQDPDIWFPEKSRWAEQAAKAICHTCPVEAQCMDYAIRNHEVGIWGGTTERQRKKIANRYVRPLPKGLVRSGFHG